ncbi:hypothetical protein AMAG_01868 [Allomyces macrogynus ATCC 38327]|uniref:CobW/HypB/UreG nucleotide-binding domain-containing protein n=1 Tax=Allomyces macrogynus (strain ATCC 38327) TaxID=578462 RepID=A0A0L0S0V2_ALLM3|nr:hypothetical protein AMAG_01868 [Allomyces macrogynus ATCC 38327]|eukprot:KNE56025.1 hypothetical protein AMAG_01868 [Allomyces macrogynus ATCC 38327]
MSSADLEQADAPVQVTVVTGFLGAGKTTIILDLIHRLNASTAGYNVCLLKNEFGSVEVDSLLAQEGSIKVTEMLNGCLCCVLVGQMKNALEELQAKYNPDRIIIESSGSAFPAPIAWQIRQMEPKFHLDSIITVVDCVNFRGYEDTSYTAKMQAAYTDLILLNKWQLATERDVDLVIDRIDELNEDTPKVKYSPGLSLDVVFGLDTKLFSASHGTSLEDVSAGLDKHHMENEVDLVLVKQNASDEAQAPPTVAAFESFLGTLSKDTVYRVKGLVQLHEGEAAEPSLFIVNHAFGRTTLTKVANEAILSSNGHVRVSLTVMGVYLRMQMRRLREFFGELAEIDLTEAHRH